ncbi:hypothetical protein [Streptosporangium vulgare]|uniref:hypothetical protein n=1 Tax=Streptosporangium vulgare TaxID=46190 RepID=UPI0031DCB734
MVERADSPRCGLAVGDHFEVEGTALTLPQGRPSACRPWPRSSRFWSPGCPTCPPTTGWSASLHLLPRPADAVIMRLDGVDRVDRLEEAP